MGLVVALAAVCGMLLADGLAAEKEFYGTVEKMPASGRVGEWVISGRTVHVVPDTNVKEKGRTLQIGAYVEVQGVESDGKFIATKLKPVNRR